MRSKSIFRVSDCFHRPNEPGQSNMSPQDGATLWTQHIEPKRALGYQTCSPATSSNPNGFTWIDNMLSACNGGCTVRRLGWHTEDRTHILMPH